MRQLFIRTSLLVAYSSATEYFDIPSGGYRPFGPGYSNGAYPQDFALIGPPLEAVHRSQRPPTGLAVDTAHSLYLTYPRNSGQTPSNVVFCTSFNDERPWPNAAIQNCTTDQLWVADYGVPYNAAPGSAAVYGGAKLMSFNETTAEHLRTYVIPQDLLSNGMNMNDLRLKMTLGGGSGYAFITDATKNSSLPAINFEDGSGVRRLFNTSVVRADKKYVGTYDGQLIYTWNGTKKGHLITAADGLALASGNFYWGVLASRRFY